MTSVRDECCGRDVAMKKLCAAFSNLEGARSALREVVLLRHLRHANVVALHDLVVPSNAETFMDVYIATELMHDDLQRVIANNGPLGAQAGPLLAAILSGVSYLHRHDLYHGDIKPSNVLINADGGVRICDLGSCFYAKAKVNNRCNATTLWYRPPEVLMGLPSSFPQGLFVNGEYAVNVNV